MKFDQILYNKIFNITKHKAFGDEEVAMSVCEKVFVKSNEFSAISEHQVWTYIYKTIETTKIDIWRKNKNKIKSSYIDYELNDYTGDVEDNANFEFSVEKLDNLLISGYIKQQEMDFLLQYYSRKRNKLEPSIITNKEKVKTTRIIQRIKQRLNGKKLT
jgi:DNA-directed RNA polymerase specialized sigma24 family protein